MLACLPNVETLAVLVLDELNMQHLPLEEGEPSMFRYHQKTP